MSLRQFALSLHISIISFTSLNAIAAAEGGLNIGLSVDTLGELYTRKEDGSNQLNVREAELSFSAPIDHRFEGTLSLAAHREGGVSLFEIHEAFISTSKTVPNTRLKLGQYFLGVGRLNQFHRHDWPFVSAPKVHKEFFGEEGVLDAGLEASTLLPLPFFVEVTLGVGNGYTFGHSHSEGQKPKVPTHYARANHFLTLPGNGGLSTGVNYIGRTDSQGLNSQIYGIDFISKWKDAQVAKFLLQSELWLRKLTPRNGETSLSWGAYAYPEALLVDALSFGMRMDYYSVLSLKKLNQEHIKNYETALVPTLTWKSSEFSHFRLAVSHERQQISNLQSNKTKIQLQSVFILGAHPAHDF